MKDNILDKIFSLPREGKELLLDNFVKICGIVGIKTADVNGEVPDATEPTTPAVQPVVPEVPVQPQEQSVEPTFSLENSITEMKNEEFWKVKSNELFKKILKDDYTRGLVGKLNGNGRLMEISGKMMGLEPSDEIYNSTLKELRDFWKLNQSSNDQKSLTAETEGFLKEFLTNKISFEEFYEDIELEKSSILEYIYSYIANYVKENDAEFYNYLQSKGEFALEHFQQQVLKRIVQLQSQLKEDAVSHAKLKQTNIGYDEYLRLVASEVPKENLLKYMELEKQGLDDPSVNNSLIDLVNDISVDIISISKELQSTNQSYLNAANTLKQKLEIRSVFETKKEVIDEICKIRNFSSTQKTIQEPTLSKKELEKRSFTPTGDPVKIGENWFQIYGKVWSIPIKVNENGEPKYEVVFDPVTKTKIKKAMPDINIEPIEKIHGLFLEKYNISKIQEKETSEDVPLYSKLISDIKVIYATHFPKSSFVTMQSRMYRQVYKKYQETNQQHLIDLGMNPQLNFESHQQAYKQGFISSLTEADVLDYLENNEADKSFLKDMKFARDFIKDIDGYGVRIAIANEEFVDEQTYSYIMSIAESYYGKNFEYLYDFPKEKGGAPSLPFGDIIIASGNSLPLATSRLIKEFKAYLKNNKGIDEKALPDYCKKLNDFFNKNVLGYLKNTKDRAQNYSLQQELSYISPHSGNSNFCKTCGRWRGRIRNGKDFDMQIRGKKPCFVQGEEGDSDIEISVSDAQNLDPEVLKKYYTPNLDGENVISYSQNKCSYKGNSKDVPCDVVSNMLFKPIAKRVGVSTVFERIYQPEILDEKLTIVGKNEERIPLLLNKQEYLLFENIKESFSNPDTLEKIFVSLESSGISEIEVPLELCSNGFPKDASMVEKISLKDINGNYNYGLFSNSFKTWIEATTQLIGDSLYKELEQTRITDGTDRHREVVKSAQRASIILLYGFKALYSSSQIEQDEQFIVDENGNYIHAIDGQPCVKDEYGKFFYKSFLEQLELEKDTLSKQEYRTKRLENIIDPEDIKQGYDEDKKNFMAGRLLLKTFACGSYYSSRAAIGSLNITRSSDEHERDRYEIPIINEKDETLYYKTEGGEYIDKVTERPAVKLKDGTFVDKEDKNKIVDPEYIKTVKDFLNEIKTIPFLNVNNKDVESVFNFMFLSPKYQDRTAIVQDFMMRTMKRANTFQIYKQLQELDKDDVGDKVSEKSEEIWRNILEQLGMKKIKVPKMSKKPLEIKPDGSPNKKYEQEMSNWLRKNLIEGNPGLKEIEMLSYSANPHVVGNQLKMFISEYFSTFDFDLPYKTFQEPGDVDVQNIINKIDKIKNSKLKELEELNKQKGLMSKDEYQRKKLEIESSEYPDLLPHLVSIFKEKYQHIGSEDDAKKIAKYALLKAIEDKKLNTNKYVLGKTFYDSLKLEENDLNYFKNYYSLYKFEKICKNYRWQSAKRLELLNDLENKKNTLSNEEYNREKLKIEGTYVDIPEEQIPETALNKLYEDLSAAYQKQSSKEPSDDIILLRQRIYKDILQKCMFGNNSFSDIFKTLGISEDFFGDINDYVEREKIFGGTFCELLPNFAPKIKSNDQDLVNVLQGAVGAVVLGKSSSGQNIGEVEKILKPMPGEKPTSEAEKFIRSHKAFTSFSDKLLKLSLIDEEIASKLYDYIEDLQSRGCTILSFTPKIMQSIACLSLSMSQNPKRNEKFIPDTIGNALIMYSNSCTGSIPSRYDGFLLGHSSIKHKPASTKFDSLSHVKSYSSMAGRMGPIAWCLQGVSNLFKLQGNSLVDSLNARMQGGKIENVTGEMSNLQSSIGQAKKANSSSWYKIAQETSHLPSKRIQPLEEKPNSWYKIEKEKKNVLTGKYTHVIITSKMDLLNCVNNMASTDDLDKLCLPFIKVVDYSSFGSIEKIIEFKRKTGYNVIILTDGEYDFLKKVGLIKNG